MPRAGQVRVRTSAAYVAEAAGWLCSHEPPPPTALNDGDDETYRAEAARVGLALTKVARRNRRSDTFEMLLDRETAEWLSTLRISVSDVFSLPPGIAGVFGISGACRAALRRPGRPKRNKAEIEARAAGAFHVGERHQKRSKRDLKYEIALENWVLRGNSVLGAGEPPPTKVT